ncbi:NAD(P)/FAD-dependent oxidoreductase [Patescibacteria group bacterium]|nr:NAD(P)/FAD-dependent oxidoreductase [Patescibacteria group bacterium]MBU1964051.1 NAD(P)/FAD-dependent oxidoreductase [Patescibacteria group bacterium]
MGEIYDVIIIGGGRSGLAVAREISSFTQNFKVIEARSHIGCDPNPVVGTFEETNKKFHLQDIILNDYNQVNFYSDGGYNAHTQVPTCIFRPDDLLKLLAKNIEDKIVTDCRVSHFMYLPKKAGTALITDKGDEYRAKIIIDASGPNSFSSRALGGHMPHHWCDCYILQIQNCDLITNECSYFAGDRIANCGAWLYPINSGTAQLGLADFNISNKVDSLDHHERLLKLLRDNPLLKKRAGKAQIIPDSFRRFRYPNGLISDFTADNLMIIGDAAGQATPLWAEGTRIALETSKIVSRVIEHALQERDYSHEMLRQYQFMWNDQFHWGYFWSALMRDFVPLMKDWQWNILTENIEKLSPEEQSNMLKTDFNFNLIYKLMSPKFFLGHKSGQFAHTMNKMFNSFMSNYKINPSQKSYVWDK